MNFVAEVPRKWLLYTFIFIRHQKLLSTIRSFILQLIFRELAPKDKQLLQWKSKEPAKNKSGRFCFVWEKLTSTLLSKILSENFQSSTSTSVNSSFKKLESNQSLLSMIRRILFPTVLTRHNLKHNMANILSFQNTSRKSS